MRNRKVNNTSKQITFKLERLLIINLAQKGFDKVPSKNNTKENVAELAVKMGSKCCKKVKGFPVKILSFEFLEI